MMGFFRGIFKPVRSKAGGLKRTSGHGGASELALVLNHIPMGIYWKDAKLVYRGGNTLFGELAHLELGDLPGKTDQDIHVPETAARFRQEDMAFLTGTRREMYFTDKLIPLKGAAPMWARTYKIPIFDGAGNVAYIMGMVQDVTKIKHNEIALAESESRLRTILDATGDHVIFVDTSGKILVANDSFLNDFSLVKDAAIDKKLQEIVSPGLYDRFMEQIRRVEETRRPGHFELPPGESPLGGYLDVAFYPVLSGGESIGTAIYVKDITERKLAETAILQHSERLQAAITEAENASKSKSEFLSRMSHEIRTPLNAIIGMTKIASSTEELDKIKDCLQKIDSSSRHLLGLINDILDMSKIEAGKFALSNTAFRFEDMLKDISNVLSVRVDEKKQDFEILIDSALPACFCADELRLRQVLTNLVSNSVKFTPENGSIRLGTKLLGISDDVAAVEFTVSDTGIGIPPDQQERLFQPFEQADGSITRKFGGTGLGLVICKAIIEMMGGRIRFESELGKGSRFIFDVRMKIQYDADGESAITFNNMSALIVDDSEETREYLSRILTSFGIRSDTAEDGFTAVEKVRAAKLEGDGYNVFFIDWAMPGMDGIKTARIIKTLANDNAVVIMISATAWNEIEKDASAAGIRRFVPKPLFPSTIMSALQEIAGVPERRAVRLDQKRIPDFEGFRLLVAEDIEINREIAAALLEPTKIKIEFAVDGREAVEKFSAHKDAYDLILMDIHMPEMDGYEATRIIRSGGDLKSLSIPIIAMTADAFKEDIDKCKNAGMNDHISKPVDENDLYKKILLYTHGKQRIVSRAISLRRGGDATV